MTPTCAGSIFFRVRARRKRIKGRRPIHSPKRRDWIRSSPKPGPRLAQADASLYFLQFDKSPARKEAARFAAETATRLNPSSLETLLANAYYRYHVERDYDGARVLFEKIQREAPSNSEALAALARIARRQSRWNESVHLYEQAAQLNPRDAYLVMDRAWTFSMLRQYAATAEMIANALAISPDDPEVLVSKVKLLQTTGDLPAARAILARIPAESPMNRLMAFELLSCSWNDIMTKPPGWSKPESRNRNPIPGCSVFPSGSRRCSISLAGNSEGAKQAYLAAKAGLETLRQEQPESPFVRH